MRGLELRRGILHTLCLTVRPDRSGQPCDTGRERYRLAKHMRKKRLRRLLCPVLLPRFLQDVRAGRTYALGKLGRGTPPQFSTRLHVLTALGCG